jgi:UDP-2,3-diacylglucosamine hydrolase
MQGASSAPGIAGLLRRQHASGTQLALMHGNRDFLIGARFAAACGARLLRGSHALRDPWPPGAAQPRRCAVHRRPGLPAHAPLVPEAAGAARVPGTAARGCAAASPAGCARAAGRHPDKPPEITDVNPDAVAGALREAGVDCLLHGHTHRPAVHALEVDERQATRIVLGDWYTQGSVLTWDAQGFELQQPGQDAGSPE